MWEYGIEVSRHLILNTYPWTSRGETDQRDGRKPTWGVAGQTEMTILDKKAPASRPESSKTDVTKNLAISPTNKVRRWSHAGRPRSCPAKCPHLQPGSFEELGLSEYRAIPRSFLEQHHKSDRPSILPDSSVSDLTGPSCTPIPVLSPPLTLSPGSSDTTPLIEDYKIGSTSHSLLDRFNKARGSHSDSKTESAPPAPRQLAMEVHDIGFNRPQRRRAIRERINPITNRRRTKEKKEELPGRQSEDVSNTDVLNVHLNTSRTPLRPLTSSGKHIDSDRGPRYSQDPALALSQERSLWRASKIPRLSSIIRTTPAEPYTPEKLAKPSPTDHVTSGGKMAMSSRALDEEIQIQSDKVSTQTGSERTSTRPIPSPSRDYRATVDVMKRLMHGSPRSRDYRATAADMQRLMEDPPSLKNGNLGHSLLRRQSKSRKRDLPHKSREQGHKRKLDARSPVAEGNIARESASKKPPHLSVSQTSILPACNESALRCLSIQGTLDHAIELSSDSGVEDQDADIFYYCDATPVVGDLPVLTRDCVVCSDSTYIADMPSLSKCMHQGRTCAACFARWIESELTTKGWKGITCPEAYCNVILTHHEVQAYATPEVFAQFDTYSMREALGQVANFRWCRNPACTSGQEHGEDGYIFTCAACGHKACITHDVDWHEGETCDEYSYRVNSAKEREQKAQEEASIIAVNKLSKKCPGPGCAFNIQKNKGCDHMTCSRCRYEFCFECLANYQQIRSNGNTAHEEDCKYHSSRID